VFGVNPSEFIVLLVVAAVVLGPERLPEYAQQLARLVRELRRMAQGASAQVRNEMGPEFDDIDWAKLDPRQYDPRRIVREALSDVWDPDDPLGLKDGNRPKRPGDDDEVDGPGPGGADWDGEKPQSEGGPSTTTDVPRQTTHWGGVGSAVPEPAADGAGGTAGKPPASPAFDPDAT
jgi:sec-independent protein translocase protein TatB